MILFVFLSNFAWAKIEPLQLKDPGCAFPLQDVPEFMVSIGDLQITYDQHIFWKGEEVILFQNHSYVSVRPHKNSIFLFRILLALVDAPDTAINDDDLYDDVWVNNDSDDDHDARVHVGNAMTGVVRSFQLVDKDFDRIKRVRGKGFMWETRDLEPDFVVGDFAAITSKRIIIWKGNKIQMTRALFDQTMHLFKNRGRILTFESLYRAHSDSHIIPDDRRKMKLALHVAKSKIIQLFKNVDPTFDFIENVYGQGVTWRKD